MTYEDELNLMLAETNRNGRNMIIYFALAIGINLTWFGLALAEANLLILLGGFVLLTYCNGRCLYHCLHARVLLDKHTARIRQNWQERGFSPYGAGEQGQSGRG